MTVDIWSDVRCPFCYIGKHKFEAALEKFAHKKEVEVQWHSFQLDPSLQTQPELSTLDYFVRVKNVSKDQAREMFQGAQEMAANTGIKMDLDTAVVANSYRAHLLIQLAKEKGRANELKEGFFQAHFAEGKNIDDPKVLVNLAETAGLNAKDAEEALNSEEFAYCVKQDEMQAQQIGVTGVPFFIFENKYAVSGAQPSETFLEILEKTYRELF
jgi:predicted DsbA family dithiol-disulfide isomerase